MVDIHSHILYGVDDGSESIEKSVEMIRLAAQTGTAAIITTPHCNLPLYRAGYCSDDWKNRFDILKNRIKEEKIEIELFKGQEIFCTDNTPEMLSNGNFVTLNNSRYALVEFDFREQGNLVYSRLESLVAHGFVPVVAHPERYAFVQNNSNAPSIMKGIGCLFQINKSSILGDFGKGPKIVADYLIRNEYADFVASDAHDMFMRNTDLSVVYECIAQRYSQEYADYLLIYNPTSLINNEDITV